MGYEKCEVILEKMQIWTLVMELFCCGQCSD